MDYAYAPMLLIYLIMLLCSITATLVPAVPPTDARAVLIATVTSFIPQRASTPSAVLRRKTGIVIVNLLTVSGALVIAALVTSITLLVTTFAAIAIPITVTIPITVPLTIPVAITISVAVPLAFSLRLLVVSTHAAPVPAWRLIPVRIAVNESRRAAPTHLEPTTRLVHAGLIAISITVLPTLLITISITVALRLPLISIIVTVIRR